MKALISKPYAKVLREAFPHATFVGFTGTQLLRLTKHLVMKLIDIQWINQLLMD